MNWRWIVPAFFALAVIELFMGVIAYTSTTWNFDHTEILTGWPAVRLACLVFVPLVLGGCAVVGALFLALLDWASRGKRR